MINSKLVEKIDVFLSENLSESSGQTPFNINKIDWNKGKGDWVKAKQEASKIFDIRKKYDTDHVLALKKASNDQRNRGSYLAAVIYAETNDWLDNIH